MPGPKKTTLLIIIIALLLGGFGLGYVDDSANHKAPKTFLSKFIQKTQTQCIF